MRQIFSKYCNSGEYVTLYVHFTIWFQYNNKFRNNCEAKQSKVSQQVCRHKVSGKPRIFTRNYYSRVLFREKQ